jgi:hypothetical protein
VFKPPIYGNYWAGTPSEDRSNVPPLATTGNIENPFSSGNGTTTKDLFFQLSDNAPADAPTTPEPSTLLGLLAVGSLGAFTRKRKG